MANISRPPLPSKMTPKEIRNMAKQLGRTSYMSGKMDDVLKEMGVGKNTYHSATKRQTEKVFKRLRDEGLIRGERTPKKIFEDMVDMKQESNMPKRVPMATDYLPDKVHGDDFVSYVERADPKASLRAASIMKEWGWTQQKELTKNEMSRLLDKLNREGVLQKKQIGKAIARFEEIRHGHVVEAIQQELEIEERNKKRSKQHGALKEISSSIFNIDKESKEQSHPTTSALHKGNSASQEDANNDKPLHSGSSLTKQGKNKKEPGDRPESLPDMFI